MPRSSAKKLDRRPIPRINNAQISGCVVVPSNIAKRMIKMPPKKKNKLDNMSEEERRIFLEQQMLAEEEERKKKEEMLGQFLKVTHFPLILAPCLV